MDSSETITAGDNSGRCRVDNNTPPITHCVISSIDIKGGGSKASNQRKLTVDTTNGPVRIYVEGDVNLAAVLQLNTFQRISHQHI